MKKQLAEDMVQFIAPIREKAEAIYADKTYLKNVIANGAEKARVSARNTIDAAREMMGLVY
jgi:tryptophanyl-tRNA synthetase